MAGNELLVFGESLWMLGDVPLIRSAQIAGPILKKRQIDNGHGNRGPGQIGEGRAREKWTVVRSPVPPAYDLGFGAFTSQRRRLVGFGRAAMAVSEDVQVGA